MWKEPDISRTIPVRPDGKISVPLLSDVQAAGLTAMQFAASLRDSLSKYLNNPQVTVTVTEINSRRVYITGEVNSWWSSSPPPQYDGAAGTFQRGWVHTICEGKKHLRPANR